MRKFGPLVGFGGAVVVLVASVFVLQLGTSNHPGAIPRDILERTMTRLGRDSRFGSVVSQVDGQEVHLHGEVPDEQARATAEALAWQVNGVSDVHSHLRIAPPRLPQYYDFSCSRVAGVLTLNGDVPSDTHRLRIETAFRQHSSADVQNHLRVRRGTAKPGYESALALATQASVALTDGRVELIQGRLLVSGRVDTFAAERQLRLLLIQDTAYADHRVVAVEVESEEAEAADRCDLTVGALLRERIEFFPGRHEIGTTGVDLLRRIAAAIASCGVALRFEVAGHTDDAGDEVENRSLSMRRAESVVRKLIEFGVDASRLSAVGYGETRPRSDGTGPAARAQNRRIEISVVRE